MLLIWGEIFLGIPCGRALWLGRTSANGPRRAILWPMRYLLVTCLFLPVLQGQPVSAELDRKAWMLKQTLGPASLAGGAFSAGLGTWRDRPVEYGTNWKGFGQRYGLRLTGVATQNVLEAGLGAVLHEDPRYKKASGGFKARLASTLKQTIMVQRTDGTYGPAYARYAAISGGNFVSNAWRPDSEATVNGALSRTGYGFLGRLAGNAVAEFGGEAWRRIRRK